MQTLSGPEMRKWLFSRIGSTFNRSTGVVVYENKGFLEKVVADYARSLQKNLPKLNLPKRRYAEAKVKALVQ